MDGQMTSPYVPPENLMTSDIDVDLAIEKNVTVSSYVNVS